MENMHNNTITKGLEEGNGSITTLRLLRYA